MNHITKLRNIRTPQSWKEKLDKKLEQGESKRKTRYGRFPIMLAAVVAVAVLLAGSALAYAFAGGEFFADIFAKKAEKNPAEHTAMDVSQLSEIAGTTLGTAIDTDELRIDVVDIISTGSDAMVALRITAKQMDSVLYNNGIEPLKNYRFNSEDGNLFQNMESRTVGYIYSDMDTALADNQFYLLLTVRSLNGFENGPYNLVLDAFGYFDPDTAVGGGISITTVYEGPWTIKLDLSGDTEHSRIMYIGQSVDIGDYTYDIKDIYLTPFSCMVVISYEDATEDSQKRFTQIVDAAEDIAVLSSGGTPIATGEIGVSSGVDDNDWPDSSYHITFYFDVPINVEDIVSVHVFRVDYDVKALFNQMAVTAEETSPVTEDGSSYTTQWKNYEKYEFYNLIINSVDHFDYATGTLLLRKDGEEYNVSFKVNLLTGEAYEEVTDETGKIVQIEYSDGETVYQVYNQLNTFNIEVSQQRGEPLPPDERIVSDSLGNIEYNYRDDGTNIILASEYCLLPQGLAMECLSNEKNWKFIGTGNMCGYDCLAVGGELPEDSRHDVDKFEIIVDLETGVIMQYLAWDALGNNTYTCLVKSLSYEDPGSFADYEENVKALISSMNIE